MDKIKDTVMNIVILDAATLGDDLDVSVFSRLGHLTVYQTTSLEEMPERTASADVLILNKVKCNAESLKCASMLKLICVAATGYDNIDVDYCRLHGIGVCNVVGYSTDSVAAVTVATALSLATHLFEYNEYTKSGAYSRGAFANAVSPVYHELYGKTWGIYGYGNIGRRVADVARAFGCRVIVCKKTPDESVSCVSLDSLVEASDILTVHTPLNEETRGSLNRERLSRMKKGSILVNAARGAVLDEAAVAELVLNGHLGGFGTDVYSREPFPKTHPYTQLFEEKNVILTPHMAWGAREARERCMAEIFENIEAYLRGENRNRVDLAL